jgi:hypothetical protein
MNLKHWFCRVRFVPTVVVGVLLFAASASGQSADVEVDRVPTQAEIEARYDAGAAAFAAGLELLNTDPTTARMRLGEAAATWEEIVHDAEIQSSAMQYNIGNARLLGGDVGRAILAYRRAERLHVGSGVRVETNLEQARSQVRTKIDAGAESWFLRIVFYWHERVPGRWRCFVFFGTFVFCWVWFIARLVLKVRGLPQWRASIGRWPGVTSGVVAMILLGSLLADEGRWFERDAGVVLKETVGRKGPSESGYAASFSEALAPGVEFEILESRSGWLFVKLADGRTTWVDRGDVGEV